MSLTGIDVKDVRLYIVLLVVVVRFEANHLLPVYCTTSSSSLSFHTVMGPLFYGGIGYQNIVSTQLDRGPSVCVHVSKLWNPALDCNTRFSRF